MIAPVQSLAFSRSRVSYAFLRVNPYIFAWGLWVLRVTRDLRLYACKTRNTQYLIPGGTKKKFNVYRFTPRSARMELFIKKGKIGYHCTFRRSGAPLKRRIHSLQLYSSTYLKREDDKWNNEKWNDKKRGGGSETERSGAKRRKAKRNEDEAKRNEVNRNERKKGNKKEKRK